MLIAGEQQKRRRAAIALDADCVVARLRMRQLAMSMHGHRELSHPEPGYYTVGIKSYGRAPTFLLLTGYEQVRSVAAAIASDMAAADNVRLVLPETGVCSTRPVTVANASAGCYGDPTPANVDVCCLADAVAEDLRKPGCGCGAAA